MLVMLASGRCRRTGRKARHICTVPKKFTVVTRSIWSASRSVNSANLWAIPAMFTRPSIWPWTSSTASGSPATASRSVTFRTWVDILAPVPRARSAVPARPASSRSTAATCAPRRARPNATSRPMPLPAPVTTKTLSAMRIRILRFGEHRHCALQDRVLDRGTQLRAQRQCLSGMAMRVHAPLPCGRAPLHAGLFPAGLAHQHARTAGPTPDRPHGRVGEPVVGPHRHLLTPTSLGSRPAARLSWTSLSQASRGRVVSISNSKRSTMSGVTSATST